MTWQELAEFYFPAPEYHPHNAGYALENFTCYPFGSPKTIAKQLDQASRRGFRAMHHVIENELSHAAAHDRRHGRSLRR